MVANDVFVAFQYLLEEVLQLEGRCIHGTNGVEEG